MVETIMFVGIDRGINIPGFLRWCRIRPSIQGMALTCKPTETTLVRTPVGFRAFPNKCSKGSPEPTGEHPLAILKTWLFSPALLEKPAEENHPLSTVQGCAWDEIEVLFVFEAESPKKHTTRLHACKTLCPGGRLTKKPHS